MLHINLTYMCTYNRKHYSGPAYKTWHELEHGQRPRDLAVAVLLSPSVEFVL